MPNPLGLTGSDRSADRRLARVCLLALFLSFAVAKRDEVAKKMDASQIAEAAALADQWQKK
jgi:hypothetical protein